MRDAHLVVLGVVHDERPASGARQQQRRPRDPGPQIGGREHRGLPVAQQGHEAPQAAVEHEVGLRLGGELQIHPERRVPVHPHAIPVGEVVAGLGPERGERVSALRGGQLSRRPAQRREPARDQTGQELGASDHAPNLSPSLCRAAGAAVPLPALASTRSQPAPAGARRAHRAGRRVRGVQPAVGARRATRAVRLDVEHRPASIHRPLDRLAAAGMDLLRAGRGLPARQGGVVVGGPGARCAVRGCRRCEPRSRRESGTTAHCAPRTVVAPPLSRPRRVLLRRRRRRALVLRHLERLSPSPPHAPHASLPRSARGSRGAHAVAPLRPARRRPPRGGQDAGDRGPGQRAPPRPDRSDGRHDRHLAVLHSGVRTRVPRPAGPARRGDGAREP